MYVIISIFILFFSVYLFKKSGAQFALNKINMVSYVFYHQLIIQSYVGAVVVVNQWDNHYMINKLTNQNSRIYGWLAIMYVMIMLPVGMIFVNKLFRHFFKPRFALYLNQKIAPLYSRRDSYVRWPLYFLSFLSIFALLYTFYQLKTIPLLKMLTTANALLLAQFRIEASREFGGVVYIRNIFGLLLSPILAYISFAYYSMTKSKKDLFWALMMMFVAVNMVSYNLAKAPLVQLMIGYLFTYIYLKGAVKYKTIVIVGILSFAFLVLLYSKMSTGPMGAGKHIFSYLFLNINSGITGRLFLGQVSGTFLSFDFFPSTHDFIGFSSFSRLLSNVSGFEYSERSARLIMQTINPSGMEAGTAGVINSLFIGEAWANFGFFGVLIAPLIVGGFIQFFYLFFTNLDKTPLFLGYFAYISYKLPVTGGFNDFIYNVSLVMLFVILLMIFTFALSLVKMKTGRFLVWRKR